MTLPISGAISLDQVRTELAASGAISLGATNVRTLFGKPSGTISLGDGYGKSSISQTFGFSPSTSFFDNGGWYDGGGTSASELVIRADGYLGNTGISYVVPPVAGVGMAYSVRFVVTVSAGSQQVFGSTWAGVGYDSGYVSLSTNKVIYTITGNDYGGGYAQGTLYIKRNSDSAVTSCVVGFTMPGDY